MSDFVISSQNIALIDLLSEARKAALIDAICAKLRGREPTNLDEPTSIVFRSIMTDNEKFSLITKSSLVLDVIPTNQERIKEKVCSNEHTKEKKERMTFSLRTDEGVLAAFEDFSRMRKKIKKPLTDLAVTRAWNKLDKLSGGDKDTAIAILNQSVDHCWQDLYGIQDEPKSTSNQPCQRNPKIQNAYGFSTERNTDYNAEVWRRIRERWSEEDDSCEA